jgi:hypothetical protein
MAKTVKLYVSTECGVCEEVKTAVKDKNYEVVGVSADIEMIDIDDIDDDVILENFPGVPGAQYGERTCELYIDEKNQRLMVDCSKD